MSEQAGRKTFRRWVVWPVSDAAFGGIVPGTTQNGEPPLFTRRLVAVLAAVLVLAACTAAERVPAAASRGAESTDAIPMTMYRSPDCSCCHLWADIARAAGWTVASADKVDMAAFKADVGVPPEYASCHTTMVGGYFVEGHVPVEAVERLLAERPDIDGIALPGMPAGSPGMGGAQGGPFEVLAITDGVATLFGSH